MSQLLVLAKPRHGADLVSSDCVFLQTENPTLRMAARLALGVREDDVVFTVASPVGEPFEKWFDALPFDIDRTDQLIDVCVVHFEAMAFFYADARDLERARDLDELKSRVRQQFCSTPIELDCAWVERSAEGKGG